MATTSLWRIKGGLNRVIEYIENPEKTSERSEGGEGKGNHSEVVPDAVGSATIGDVLDYVTRDSATDHAKLVTAINCTLKNATEEMMKTKKAFGKTGGTVAYHGYQSFKEGEVTPQQVHLIGELLAQELWGDRYEVVVATHVDKESHIHNHFLINTVSFVDGKKFHRTKQDYLHMQQVSDRLCRENGLSVVRHPEDGRGKNYGEWDAERKGRPTHRSMIRHDIDRAIRASLTEREFFHHLEEMGYAFKLRSSKGEELLRPSLKPKGAQRFFRFDRLGEGYDLEEIRYRILENIRREPVIPEEKAAAVFRYRKEHPPRTKHKGLAALYYYYCYELHIIVKHPASVKRVSFFMREDLRKLDRLDAQTRLLGNNDIETIGDLDAFRDQTKQKIADLTSQRDRLRRELKKEVDAGSGEKAEELREEIAGIKKELARLRKDLKTCDGIEERAEKIREELMQFRETERPDAEKKQETKEKEKTKEPEKRGKEERDELLRRRGGTGREDVLKRH